MASSEFPAYFDNNATTAVDPRVLEAMLPTFKENYGNPASAHPYGWRARVLVERARELISRLIGAGTHEIEFTSGATDSIQRAILGLINSRDLSPGERHHIITCATEHIATLDACHEAVKRGHDLTILDTDSEGRITVDQVIDAFRPNTILVSLLHGNNEIGTLHPIKEIGEALRSKRPDVLFHVDAAQTAGKHEIDVDKMHIDLLSLSGHKFHGPKGIGALYKRSSPGRRVHLKELHHGTLNVSGIVGLGAAAEIAHIEGASDRRQMLSDRDLILETIEQNFGAFGAVNGIYLNGARVNRLCNNISLTISGVEADQMMIALKDIAYSAASACTGPSESHVLKAIGRPTGDPFLTTVRFGLSRMTTPEDVSLLISRLIDGVRTTREISGSYDSTTKPVR